MHPNHVVVIGSSAGGPRIVKELFNNMPRLDGAVILVQHMPEFVNKPFCKSLDVLTGLNVQLAVHNDFIKRGFLYIAPSGKHMILKNNSMIQLVEGEKVNFVCPAVDVTMKSLSSEPGMYFTGIVLTGMGKDGAEGISYMKKLGSLTIAQDEQTSVIYGMPKEAAKTGDVDWILPPQQIAKKMIERVGIMTD